MRHLRLGHHASRVLTVICPISTLRMRLCAVIGAVRRRLFYKRVTAWFSSDPAMLLPAVVVLSCLLSSAVAGPHARLKSPKKWAKKTGLIEILSTPSPSNATTFSPVAVAPKTNIFISLTDDEAASFFYPYNHPPFDNRHHSPRPRSSASFTIKRS